MFRKDFSVLLKLLKVAAQQTGAEEQKYDFKYMIYVIGSIFEVLFWAKQLCFGCSVAISTTVTIQQSCAWTLSHWVWEGNCLHFDITIVLLFYFLLGSYTQSLIMKSDCCGFCQITKSRAEIIIKKSLICARMFLMSNSKVNPKHLSSDTSIVIRKWSNRWQIFYFLKT